MIQKIKTFSPYFLILFLVILLIGFNSLTSDIEAGDTSGTQVVVGNADPVVSSVSLNWEDNINLNENSTKNIPVRALVTDSNGCQDIWDGTTKAYVFQNLAQGVSCSADLDDCYLIASCSTDASRNNCTGGSDTDVIMDCSVDIQYFATATDGTSSVADDRWSAIVVSTDASNGDHYTSNSAEVDVVLLRALEASDSINYDAISAGSNSGATPEEMGVRNTGNSGMDPLISATTILTCTTAETCTTSTIANANQKYASVSQDYSDPYNVALTGSNVQFNTETPKPDHTTYPVDDHLFWGLGVNAGQQAGTYQGVNTFTATGD